MIARTLSFALCGALLCACTSAPPSAQLPTQAPAAALVAAPATAAPALAVTPLPRTTAATAIATAAAIATVAAKPTAIPADGPAIPSLTRKLLLATPPLRGEDVGLLQRRLTDLGYKLGIADTIYGKRTESAVRAFQALSGALIDGVVGDETWGLLFAADAPRYDLHPIVDPRDGSLIGAASGDRWVDAERIAEIVLPQPYRLLLQESGVAAATAQGSAARVGDVPCEQSRYIELSGAGVETALLAAGGTLETLPRQVTAVPTDSAELQRPAAQALRALGVATDTVQVTGALRADLDDDGKQETVFTATYRASGAEGPQPSAAAGDYSAVLLLPDGEQTATVITADVITKAVDFGAPYQFVLRGVWDLNGDGMFEVVIDSSYYEGASVDVYTVDGVASQSVLVAGCGV